MNWQKVESGAAALAKKTNLETLLMELNVALFKFHKHKSKASEIIETELQLAGYLSANSDKIIAYIENHNDKAEKAAYEALVKLHIIYALLDKPNIILHEDIKYSGEASVAKTLDWYTQFCYSILQDDLAMYKESLYNLVGILCENTEHYVYSRTMEYLEEKG